MVGYNGSGVKAGLERMGPESQEASKGSLNEPGERGLNEDGNIGDREKAYLGSRIVRTC